MSSPKKRKSSKVEDIQVVDMTDKPSKENGEAKAPRQLEPKPSVEKSHYEEADEIIERIHCCAKLRHKLWFKIIVFLIVVALDGADLFADWLLFRDMIQTEEGLVYGPPEGALLWSQLAFSIVGTFTFAFEVVNLWWEIFRENPWINTDLASAITIWIEDVPQIIINVMIAVCREEAISYFQLVKASILIFGIIIRIVVSFIRYCSKKSLAETKEHTAQSRRHVTYRVLIVLGLIILFAGSVAVYFLTQFERTDEGEIQFNLPKTIFEGKYREEKYFSNVSIYLNHPFVDLHKGPNDPYVDFVRLISLYDVRSQGSVLFKFSYDENTRTKFVIWQEDSPGKIVAKECYEIDRAAKSVTKGSGCATYLAGNTISSFIFQFKFIPKDIPKLIFGDVRYNVKVNLNGTVCISPESNIVSRVRDRRVHNNVQDAVIHYYRTQDHVDQERHLVWSGTNDAHFFHKDYDLIDIKEVWKTGFAHCQSSGALAPHQDKNINVNCNA
ncbi:hypothetical protein FSP39_011484 [Pinctada imbricata]|uniref:Uncharacterized protein n=1 Tax=Pinctada imbricata TaxID=66713 RepID=A0AA88XFB6_PINIB|nr:hypothetical protein FSP39_011484 [Pinctada imbricata]